MSDETKQLKTQLAAAMVVISNLSELVGHRQIAVEREVTLHSYQQMSENDSWADYYRKQFVGIVEALKLLPDFETLDDAIAALYTHLPQEET